METNSIFFYPAVTFAMPQENGGRDTYSYHHIFMQFPQQTENSSERQTVLKEINHLQLSVGAMMLHDRSSSLTEAAAWCSIINSCKAELNWIKCLYLLLSSKHRLPHNPPASSGSVNGDFCPFFCSSDLSFLHMMLSSANFKRYQGPLWPCPYHFQQSVSAVSLSLSVINVYVLYVPLLHITISKFL